MKNFTRILFLIFMLAVTNGHAQTKISLRAGAAYTNWRGDAMNSLNGIAELTSGIVESSWKPGFTGGLAMEFPVSSRLSIEPALYYTQKGHRLTGAFSVDKLDFIEPRATLDVQSHYIDLPVLARVQVAEGLQVFAGPQVSYLVHNNLRARASVLGINLMNTDLDITDPFSRFDAALTAGLGYQFPNGFQVQAAYDHGLRRLDKNGTFNTFNSGVRVMIGYRF